MKLADLICEHIRVFRILRHHPEAAMDFYKKLQDIAATEGFSEDERALEEAYAADIEEEPVEIPLYTTNNKKLNGHR